MKKVVLSFVCCMLLMLSGCSGDKGGKVVDISAEEAVSKIEKKDSFLLIVSLDTCPHCEDLKAMLKETISKHATVVYRVELQSEVEEKLYQDVDLLKKALKDPETIPHIYFIEKGKEKADYDGYDENNSNQFWDFVKEHKIENLK